MTIENEDRKNLISYRLEQAEETIQDVKLLIDNDRLRSAVNRITFVPKVTNDNSRLFMIDMTLGTRPQHVNR